MTPGDTCDGAYPTPPSSPSAAIDKDQSESKGAAGGEGAAEASSSGTAAGTGGVAVASSGMKKGPWTAAEDAILMEYVREHGEGNWNAVQRSTGLSRCGKSCRLRWANHLRPNLKKGSFSPEEERLILRLHAQMGNKWARMAAQLPGRTDNEIKNYWNTRLKRRLRAGLPLYPPDVQRQAALHRLSTSSTLAPPSLFYQKPHFSAPVGNTPFTLFDPINFPRTTAMTNSTVANPLLLGHPRPPLLVPPSAAVAAAGHHQRIKRLRDDDIGFSLPFGANPTPPPLTQASVFQYNPLGNYDLGPPPPSSAPLQQQQGFSVKAELPSSQLYPEPSMVAAGGVGVSGAITLPLERNNSGLLDALLRDTHQEACSSSHNSEGGDGGDHHIREFLTLEPSVPHDVNWVKMTTASTNPGTEPSWEMTSEPAGRWDGSNVQVDSKVKSEPSQEIVSMEDDFSALLDVIPMGVVAPTAAPREWLNSDSGEGSHGQSSAVTDDVELEMQQLASSLAMAPEEDHSWSMGPSHWDGTPGIR